MKDVCKIIRKCNEEDIDYFNSSFDFYRNTNKTKRENELLLVPNHRLSILATIDRATSLEILKQ